MLRSLNIRVVLAHGAAAQSRPSREEQNVKASDLDGTGITDAETLKLALTAANRLTHEILEGLSANDLRAACTNAIIAHPMGIIQGVDHLFTGKVERVDVELLQTLLAQGIVPVIPPLGFDGDGKTYRVNSDSVAVAVADALKATKLIFITTQRRPDSSRPAHPADARGGSEHTVAASAGFPPEMFSKARHAAAACTAGVQRVHIINGRVDEGLLAEVFSNEGIGTLIYANEYQQVRPAKKKDIRSIQVLTKNSVETDELVKRTRATIEKQLSDYYIFEIDKNPVACVALHVYPEFKQGRTGLPLREPLPRKSRHRPEADSICRDQSAGIGLWASCSPFPRRHSRIFNPRAVSSKARRTICRRRAGKNTTKAGATPKCW